MAFYNVILSLPFFIILAYSNNELNGIYEFDGWDNIKF